MVKLLTSFLLIFSAGSLLAQELFTYRETRSPVQGAVSPALVAAASTSWPIQVDLSHLAANPSTLDLALPSGVRHRVERVGAELRGPGSLAWWGSIDGEPGWTVSLTLQGDLISGVLLTPLGSFEIRNDPTSAGHQLVAYSDSEPWCPGGLPHPRSLLPPEVSERAVAGVEAGARADITVLALYTESAMEGRGGAAKISNEIQSAVDFLTRALGNNGLNGRASLIHIQQAPAELQGTKSLNDALDLLRRSREVATLRAEVRADIVTLFTGWLEAGGLSKCGLAYLMTRGENARSMSPWAFNTVNAECSQSVLAHEIGHNLGLNHNPEDTGIDPSSAFSFYAFGHRKGGQGSFRTIMSYGGQPRVSYFSTPSISHQGTPIGVEDERDNARTLVDSLPIGEQFQSGRASAPRPPAPGNVLVNVVSPTSVQVRWSDPANDETGFAVEHQSSGGPFVTALEVAADVVEALVQDLVPEATYTFRVRTRRGASTSNSSNIFTVTMPPALAPPDTLSAYSVSDHEIRLEWTGGSEPTATVEMRSPSRQSFDVRVVSTSAGQAILSGLDPDMPHTFRLRLENDGHTAYSPDASAATRGTTGACVAGAENLCLLEGRFEIKVRWRNQRQPDHAGAGQATPIATSDHSGLFQFFDAENIELVVKLLDGRTINDAFWHFYGALSDVEYWIVVRDTIEESVKTYHNPPNEICGAADVGAFPAGPGGALLQTGGRAEVGLSLPATLTSAMTAITGSEAAITSSEATCVASDTVLCLHQGRFSVEVDWSNPRQPGHSGEGQTLPALSTSKTGFFWFFDAGNVELAVKLLDGRAINDRFWFFWGGLSDAEYTLRVRDTVTGAEASYRNEPYNLCGGADVGAL